MQQIKGLATGIGSLPHKDADSALDLIFQYTPYIPFWPQLPKRDFREGMVAQFSEALPCIKLNKDGLLFDAKEKDEQLEGFYGRIIARDVDYFKISQDFALGLHRFYQRLKKQNLKEIEFIKCQVTGPFTFAATLKDDKGTALLYDSVFMQVISKSLAMKALWQVKLFKEFAKKIILFFDEPYLGCFGSAYTPVNKEEVINTLTEFTKDIKLEDVLLGVHCCGNTDWSIFTDISSIDIISFDAFAFLDRFVLYADDLKNFLEKGGIICWGVVPTQEFTGRQTAQSLVEKIQGGIDILSNKGLDRDLLLERLLISPSCGLGSLSIEEANSIFKLLYETHFFIKKS